MAVETAMAVASPIPELDAPLRETEAPVPEIVLIPETEATADLID